MNAAGVAAAVTAAVVGGYASDFWFIDLGSRLLLGILMGLIWMFVTRYMIISQRIKQEDQAAFRERDSARDPEDPAMTPLQSTS